MKILIFLAFLLYSGLGIHAQNFSKDFSIEGKVFNLLSNRNPAGNFNIGLKKNSDEQYEEFKLGTMELDPFIILFVNTIKSLNSTISESSSKESGRRIFYLIITDALNEGVDDAPIAGILKIENTTPLYVQNSNIFLTNEEICLEKCETTKTNLPKSEKQCIQNCKTIGSSTQLIENNIEVGTMNITNVTIEFYEGFGQTVIVRGSINLNEEYQNHPLLKNLDYQHFKNKYGVGFSSKRNIEKLNTVDLFDSQYGEPSLFIKLGESIKYDENPNERTNDYSPKNQVITIEGGKSIVLKKNPVSKLLEVLVFSDFLGIENENPNGLVQLDFSFRLNTNDTRIQVWPWLDWIAQGFGIIQYIKPRLTISKIEKKEKYLYPKANHELAGENSNQSIRTTLYTDPIDLLNYQDWSTGLDLNLLFAENNNHKYHFYLDAGISYGRTIVRDSLVSINDQGEIEPNGKTNDFGVGYFNYFGVAKIEFIPEKALSLILSYSKNYFTPTFNKPSLRNFRRTGGIKTPYKRWYNSLEMGGYIDINERGKLFARYRFNYQEGNITNNFHQIQVGYSFYLLNKTGNKSKTPDLLSGI